MQGWWAEMGRAAGCSCSSCRSSSLWDLGNLVTSGSLRVAQLCPAWEKEMENLRTEQEGKAGAAVGRLGLPVFPLLAEEGGKSHHLGKKKKREEQIAAFSAAAATARGTKPAVLSSGLSRTMSKGSCWSPIQAGGEQRSPAAGMNPGSPKHWGWQGWAC